MSFSFEYDTDYNPSAPVIEIGVRRAGQEQPEDLVQVLVDSGADATTLPERVLVARGARRVERRQVRGISGPAYPVNLYLVTIRVGSHLLPGIRAIAIADEEEALVGRDVLDHLVVTLHGPASTLEVAG